MRFVFLLSLIYLVPSQVFSQEKQPIETILEKEGLEIRSDGRTARAATYKPLMLILGEGEYVRFLIWHQQWITTSNLRENGATQMNHMIRRSRFLAYAQLHPDVLILTHWGLNNLNAENMTALGNDGDGPQLFLHDAWTEFRLADELFIGGGLHYFRGLTRLSSQSTLNFMTLDQSRPFVHWHALGITDQFVRPMGMYLKGEIDRMAYRVSWNNPIRSPLNNGASFGQKQSDWIYNGVNVPDASGNRLGNNVFEGYFNWFFMEKESTKLPYWVGAYLGTKRILNVGTGFFFHPNGMISADSLRRRSVLHTAIDLFADLPIPNFGSATIYSSLIHFNYGRNYMSRWTGSGMNTYFQLGAYHKKSRLMPYVSWQMGNYQALNRPLFAIDTGVTFFMMDHHAKISAEYHSMRNFSPEGGLNGAGNPLGMSQFRIQAHIFF